MSLPNFDAQQEPLCPDGVIRRPLEIYRDPRGWVSELYRQSWPEAPELVQWTLSASNPNTLRGVHVHLRRCDYLIMLQGGMSLGLSDLRRNSPTFRQSAVAELTSDCLEIVVIPPGVAHGFYFPEGGLFALGMSVYWGEDDDFGCRWDDPTLDIKWDVGVPVLSERDANAGTLVAMEFQLDGKLGSSG